MGTTTKDDELTPPLSADEVAEFQALWRLGNMLRYEQDKLVREIANLTGESDDDGDWSSTVAWDVVHNGDDLETVLRRCDLSVEVPS